MRSFLFIFSATLCGQLLGAAIHPGLARPYLEAVRPLPGYACATLRGTPGEMLTKRVPLYDKADPQARRPLISAAGQPAIAPFIVLVHSPELVEHGMVAMTTYDGREGWIRADAINAPLPLPPKGARGALPRSCQPAVMSNGQYGAS